MSKKQQKQQKPEEPTENTEYQRRCRQSVKFLNKTISLDQRIRSVVWTDSVCFLKYVAGGKLYHEILPMGDEMLVERKITEYLQQLPRINALEAKLP